MPAMINLEEAISEETFEKVDEDNYKRKYDREQDVSIPFIDMQILQKQNKINTLTAQITELERVKAECLKL